MNQPRRDFDQIDLKILDVLQKDGRISNADLADKVGLSASPCLRRMRALEEDGVISGYRADLDPVQLGLTILAFVEVRISRHGAGTAAVFREAMMKERLVVGCYMVTGSYDFLLKVVARDLESYKAFTLETLLGMPDVQDIRTSIVLDLIKNTAELPLPSPRGFA
jgi:Lrp/AsnC family transcriptional regulator, leucine-responsive regulatory protein